MSADDSILYAPEAPEDAVGIRGVHRAAFGRDLEAGILDALRDADAIVLSLVARSGGEIIGNVVFSSLRFDVPQTKVRPVGLGPVAVMPGWQGRGIGSALIRQGIVQCRELGMSAVFVLGDPAYYGRFGFVSAEQYGIRCEFNVPPEYFMVTELVPGVLAGVGGIVRYHASFAAAGPEE